MTNYSREYQGLPICAHLDGQGVQGIDNEFPHGFNRYC